MRASHSSTSDWGKLYRLHFWRWGLTLDWGEHRFIVEIIDRSGDAA